MLEISNTTSETSVDQLAERCAKVMKQQQLSAEQFLARFFHADILTNHIATYYLNKSGKGTSAQLAERIANQWAKNTTISKADVVAKKDASLKLPHIPAQGGTAECTSTLEIPEVTSIASKTTHEGANGTRHEPQRSETLALPTSKQTRRKTDRQGSSFQGPKNMKRRRSSS
jgi:hypothetical protein